MTSWGVPVGHTLHLPVAHATSMDPALTGLLQCYQHGLLDEIPLDEAAEILRVHGEVGQLEGADGHLQQMFATAAVAGDVGTGQGHDGGAGVGDASGQALLWGNEEQTAKWGRSSKSHSSHHQTAAVLAASSRITLAQAKIWQIPLPVGH